jgi:archaeal preflagellin peptidase FlaK
MNDIIPWLDVTRLIVGTLILGYASYTDIKTRRASNILWVIMGLVGGILLVYQMYLYSIHDIEMFELMKLYLIFIPFMIGLVYVLFQMRLIFGGADAKALMALALLLPFPVLNWIPTGSGLPSLPLFQGMVNNPLPYCWGVFINALFLFLFIPIALLVYNIVKKNFDFPHVFLGYKMSIDKAKEEFVWPMEQITEDGEKKFVYMPKEFDAEEELEKFIKKGYKEVWVTPKIPFMIPLLIGYISVFIFGSFLSYLMGTII